MRFAVMIFIIIVVVYALPNPFNFPFLGGGNHLLGSTTTPRKKPGNPSKPDKDQGDPSATGPRPWVTLPFAPALNVPFYVPTIFGPRSTTIPPTIGPSPTASIPTAALSGSAPASPIYSTIPKIATTIPQKTPSILKLRGMSPLINSVPEATPLPTVLARGRPAFPFDVEPVTEEEMTGLA